MVFACLVNHHSSLADRTGATIKIPIPLPISCINWLGYAQSKMIFHLLVRVGGVEPLHFHFVAPIV